jgi:hypothetical protein
MLSTVNHKSYLPQSTGMQRETRQNVPKLKIKELFLR